MVEAVVELTQVFARVTCGVPLNDENEDDDDYLL